MSQAIQRGSGQSFAAENFRSAFERKIGRHDQALTFVGRADYVEEQLGTDLAGWYVTQFIQNQQIQFRNLFSQS